MNEDPITESKWLKGKGKGKVKKGSNGRVKMTSLFAEPKPQQNEELVNKSVLQNSSTKEVSCKFKNLKLFCLF